MCAPCVLDFITDHLKADHLKGGDATKLANDGGRLMQIVDQYRT